jgi:peroxiredoxin
MKRERLVFLVLLGSVLINVVLAHRLRRYSHVGVAAGQLLKSGATVPPIEANRPDGQKETISYDQANQTTVLYIFTPTCIWCARNLDNLKTLIGKESGQYRFVGLSLSDTGVTEYVAKNELKFPV